MRIAIIGGGAAGMTTAYLLDSTHDVTVFEKQPILGGNIRTLNKNVTDVDLPPDIIIDSGVIEFQRDHFINFHKLMKKLGVATKTINGGSSSLYLANGRYILGPGIVKNGQLPLRQRLAALAKLLPIGVAYARFMQQTDIDPSHFKHQPLSTYLHDHTWHRWQKMLLMYAYSIPYNQITGFPAEIAMPILRTSGVGTKWTRVVGGVYTYIEKILAQFKGAVYCGVDITAVKRHNEGVQLSLATGAELAFDKVVFATPPDQVLQLLADPIEAERRCFTDWEANQATTVIHTDTQLYKRYGHQAFTEFDMFEKENGDAGYNAYLNRLCGLPETAPHYNLAYNLIERLDPAKIIQQQHHHTPLYTTAALRYRDEIIATNGGQHTYHAGAFLDNGLHEGAVNSGLAISGLLDGHMLD